MIRYLKYLFNWVPGFDPRIIPSLLFQKNPKKKKNKINIFFGNCGREFFEKKIYGGKIKLFYLKNAFEQGAHANILYLVSSALPSGWIWSLFYFKVTGRKVVLNQNGVYYPEILPFFYSIANLSNIIILIFADYVIYQSKFCRKMALKYLTNKKVDHKILYNPAQKFRLKKKTKKIIKNIAMMGNQYEKYRLDRALSIASFLQSKKNKFIFYIYGLLNWSSNILKNKQYLNNKLNQKKLQGHVIYKGPYKRVELPSILRKTDILLHTKNLDPCPSAVVEAIRNGIPVVYIKNGGTSELVGPGGIGVVPSAKKPAPCNPLEHRISVAINLLISKYPRFSKLAKKQGEKYSIEKWIRQHYKIFKKLNK